MLGFETPVTTGTLALLALALAIACLFEACNGFHDTANAVATVIYTRSLKPTVAVLWSGFCNFVGVIVSLWLGAGVAMGLVKLLPSEVLLGASMGQAIALILAMLLSATIWNLGTWYYGIPSSSSHAMIGSILGVGVAVSFLPGHVRFQGVNWGKALETLQALALSPIFGFGAAFGLLVLLRRLVRDQRLFHAPEGADQPPGWIRAVLVGTCTLVSGAHGFNDGQKGIGLVMIVLMSALPADYALNHSLSRDDTVTVVRQIADLGVSKIQWRELNMKLRQLAGQS